MFTNWWVRWGTVVFVVGVIVRVAYLGVSIHAAGQDPMAAIRAADGYFVVAQNLVQGHGLTQSTTPPYEAYSFRPPLFHYFLAGSYELLGSWWGVILLYIVIGSVLPVLAMVVSSYLVERRGVLLAVGLLLAVEPSAILYSTMFYSETFFMLWLYAALWALFAALTRRDVRLLALSALLMGLATLTRPTTEFVPILVGLALLWEARSFVSAQAWGRVALYAAIFLVVLSPWVYRNWAVFGVPGISPQTGVNLRMTLLPTVRSIERGTSFQTEFSALEASGVKGPNDASIVDGAPDMHAAVPELLAHPKPLALSAGNSIWSFFVLDGVFDFLRHVNVRPAQMLGKPSLAALFGDPRGFVMYFVHNLFGPLAFILLGRVLWVAIALLCVLGAWRYVRTHGATAPAVIAIGLVLYLAATSAITGYGLTARYRLPVNALVLTFAVYELVELAALVRSKRYV